MRSMVAFRLTVDDGVSPPTRAVSGQKTWVGMPWHAF